MAGLESLNPNAPVDSDPVSLGDDAIRETRSKTITTVGVEHYLDGPHKLPSGTTSARPAAGRSGRVYFNTDSKSTEYDDGTAWQGYTTRKAAATILWHGTNVGLTGSPIEIPFDYIIDDPGGYASTQYHQIVMPPNSMGIVTSFVQLDAAPGGYGATLNIEQWDGGTWQQVATSYNQATQFFNCTSMVDSRWGQNLRATFLGPPGRTIIPLALGNSPRFGFHMIGRTS